MKTIVPYTKELDLKTKATEITSISLEHQTDMIEGILRGEFNVSGDYKTHEISINKEPFEFKLPFEVDLGNKVTRDSVNFEILDFTYELKDNILRVDIEFSVEADEVANEEEEIFDPPEDIRLEEDLAEELEEYIQPEVEEERIDAQSEETILNSAVEEETYHTYHIHIVKEDETIDTICSLYNIDIDYLKEYNDVEELISGDKLIIPENINE